MHARIDHIFMAASAIPYASKAFIRDSPLSDYSMVMLYLSKPSDSDGKFRWRLNESLHSNPVQCTILEKEIREYFRVNDNGEVPPETLWVAVLRGKIIQISTKLKQERQADLVKSRNFKSSPKYTDAMPLLSCEPCWNQIASP